MKSLLYIGFRRNKEYNFDLVLKEQVNFSASLNALMQILKNSGNHEQSTVIYSLIKLFDQDKLSEFVKLINGVEMWGGAGAVWEVHIADEVKATEFEKEILNLIDLMEKVNILGKGIKSIKRILEINSKK